MSNFFLSCLYSLLGGLGYTLICNLRGRLLILSSIGGTIGLTVFYLFSLSGNDILQSFFATIAISIYSEVMSRICKTPVTIFLIVGVLPLVPGGGLYYTMEYCINGNIPMFIEEGLHTFFIAGAIAVGIILVSSVVRLYYRIKASVSKKVRL